MFNSISIWGQFHPLLTHLPIGFILAAISFYWFEQYAKVKKLQAAIEILLLLSVFFGILSAITGLILSNYNAYEEPLISKHQFSGLFLVLITSLFYVSLKIKNIPFWIRHCISIASFLCLMITGHYGGTLTHGNLSFDLEKNKPKNSYDFNDSLTIFSSMVQPVLEEKCVNCHGQDKQKGGLRLDDFENIVKGGKNGHTADAYEKNEIIRRIILSPDDKKHMPPKERTQLTSEESDLIHWWIKHDLNSEITIGQSSKNDTLITFIKSKQPISIDKKNIPFIDEKILNAITKSGAVVYSIEKKSPYLYLNLQNTDIDSKTLWDQLALITPNVVEVKLTGKDLNNELLEIITKMDNLEVLDLSNSTFSENKSISFSLPKKLKTLNLSNSKNSEIVLAKITDTRDLKKIFMYNIDPDSLIIQKLKKNQHLEIIYGKAIVPIFESDTTIVK